MFKAFKTIIFLQIALHFLRLESLSCGILSGEQIIMATVNL